MDEATLADIALPNGRFRAVASRGKIFGLLSLGTPMGLVRTQCELCPTSEGEARGGYETGRVRAPIDIAIFDFAAAALNEIGQDAVSSGVSYLGSVAPYESSDVHAALRTLFKAALGDVDCRQEISDLARLSIVPTNVEFNRVQAEIAQRPVDPGGSPSKIAGLTPAQVQDRMKSVTRAFDLVKEALPWLTGDMRRLLAHLERGDYSAARDDLAARFVNRYGQTPTRQGGGDGEEVSGIVANYTAGGCPINVGKYRACVGCTCADPCGQDCDCHCNCNK